MSKMSGYTPPLDLQIYNPTYHEIIGPLWTRRNSNIFSETNSFLSTKDDTPRSIFC